jgi:sugar transferase (PEP-CTERM/EpsH1 system associated)
MKILFLHKQILFPRDTGGKIRVLNVLKHLGHRHEITYVCNLRKGEEPLLSQMRELGLRMEAIAGEPSRRGGARFYAEAAANVLSSRPFSVNRNYDAAVRERIEALLSRESYDLLICDTVQMARHVIGLGGPPQILFQHNVEAQILQRHAEISRGTAKRWYMRGQWNKMRRFERDCGRHFDAVIAVSQQDKRIFEEQYGWRHVHAIDTGVDDEFFQPQPSEEVANRVAFLGSMDWMPNQEGVQFFVRQVWPLVRQRNPQATFQVIGRSPPAAVRALEETPGVEIVGFVPDVRPYLAGAAVVVVPLLVGGGTRLKIYEAMAMAKPVVSTTIGAEGLPLTPGVHFLQADEPTVFADDVARLLENAELRHSLGQTADRFVRDNYGSETVARQFEEICAGVVAGSHATLANAS